MPHSGVTLLPKDLSVVDARLTKGIDRRGAGECWNWTGPKTKWGYGHIRISRNWRDGSVARVHRLVFMRQYAIVQLPRRLSVCHRCDNRLCCNPAHADMVAKGRGRAGAYGQDHHSNRLTPEQVRELRASVGSADKIAPVYGISPTMVRYIRRGLRWRHLQ